MTSQANVSLPQASNEVHLSQEMLSANSVMTSTLVTIPTTITSTTTLSQNIMPIVSTVTASPPTAAGGILPPKVTIRPPTVILQSRSPSSTSSSVRASSINAGTIRPAVILPATVNMTPKILTALPQPVINQKLSPKTEFISTASSGPGVCGPSTKPPYIQISASGRPTVVAATATLPLRPQLQPQTAHQNQTHIQQIQSQIQPSTQQVSCQPKHNIISPAKQTYYTISTNAGGGKAVITGVEQATSASAKKIHLKLDGVISATNRPGLAPITASPVGRVLGGAGSRKKFISDDINKKTAIVQIPVQKSVLDLSQTSTLQQPNIRHQAPALTNLQLQQPMLQASHIPVQQVTAISTHVKQPQQQQQQQQQQPPCQQVQVIQGQSLTQLSSQSNNDSVPSKSILVENGTSLKRTEDKMAPEDVSKNDVDMEDYSQKIVIIKKHKLKKTVVDVPRYPVNHYQKESDIRRVPGNEKKTQLNDMLKEAQVLLSKKCNLTAFIQQMEQCAEQVKQIQATQKELLEFCERDISATSAKAAMSTLFIEAQNDPNCERISPLDRIALALNDRIRSNIQRVAVDIESLEESKKLLEPYANEHKERIYQLCKMNATQEAKRGNRHSKS